MPASTPPAPASPPATPVDAAKPAAPAATSPPGAPAAKPEDVGWAVQPDPPRELPAWPASLHVAIPIPAGASQLTYPATPSPFVVVGLNAAGGKGVQVWNLLTQKKAGQLTEPVEKVMGAEFALSPDGQYLAARGLVSGHSSTLRLWSFQTGRLARELPCDDPLINLQAFEFLSAERLMTYTFGAGGGRFVYRLRVWDVATGQRLHELELTETYQRAKMAVSPGGRYLVALGSRETLLVWDLQAGTLAGKADVQTLLVHSPGAYQGMSFAPDGKLLAMVYADTNSKVVFLDMASGTIADQFELAGKPPTASAYRGEAVEWLGDRGWCLFGGTVIDRTTRRVVWNLDLPITDRLTPRRTLPGGWIAATGPYAKHEIRFLPIPWDKIEASLAAMQGADQPHLKPGLSVSLNIRIEKLRFGTPEDTSARLADLFRERFQGDGIGVADDQPVVLNVSYSESVGETLHERKGISGPPTGRTVQATKVEVKMSLTTRAGNRSLWAQEFAYDPHLVTIINQQASDASARDAILRQLIYQLSATPIPYFVPQDKALSPLPGLTQIADERPKRP